MIGSPFKQSSKNIKKRITLTEEEIKVLENLSNIIKNAYLYNKPVYIMNPEYYYKTLENLLKENYK